MPFFCFRLIVFIIDEVNLFSFRQPMYSQNRLLFPPSSSSHMWLGDYIPVDLNPSQVTTNNLYFRHAQHYNTINICFIYLLLSDSFFCKNSENV